MMAVNGPTSKNPEKGSIRDIDPCGVCVERCDMEACMHVCRTSGLDTFPSHD